ncbi:MAG: enoyl-CoA hydratase [Anaerolinea sp.]|nr:enoyl-CoA hydratase [Anaerolinea sp.]
MSASEHFEFFSGQQETFSKTITEGESALFAGLIGENSPDIIDNTADSGDFQHRFSVNPLLLVGIIGGLLNTRIPGKGSLCVTIQYEFLAPIYCGDRIETIIEVKDFDPHKHLVTLKLNCFDRNKNQVLTGQAVMLAPV